MGLSKLRFFRWWQVYLPVPALGLWGVLLRAGWPHNHELYAHFERVEAFRRAYRAGDWFPTWTSFADRGHGDALPFFYHRLFNTIASIFAIAGGSSYAAVKISVYLVMLLGLWGMDRAVGAVGGSRFNRFVGACLVVFSNYSLVDWWVRGSMAEFTAFMLLPWVVYFLVKVLRERQGGVGLGVSLAFLFYAHSAIFYFTVLMLPLAFVVQLGVGLRRHEPWRAVIRPWLVAATMCALLAGPYALAIAFIGRAFSLEELARAWSPIRQLVPFHWIFYDEIFEWGRKWRIEIGRSLLVGAVVLAAAAAVVRAKVDRAIIGLTLFFLGFCLWLQTPLAIPFYRSFPGAMYLGFPWRLLCVVTVALVLLLCHLAAAVENMGRRPRIFARAVLGVVCAYQIAFAVAAQRPIAGAHYSRADIQAHLDHLDIGTVGEYLPIEVGGRRGLPPPRPFVQGRGCSDISMDGGTDPATNVHIRRVGLRVTSPLGCQIELNQFANPFLAVESDAAIRVGKSPEHTIVVDVPPGTVRLTLFRRSLVAVAFGEFKRWVTGK
jgi:hypothetical protein